MGSIGLIKDSSLEKKGSAPGKSIVIQTEAAGGQERKTEFYQLPGIASGPTPDSVPVEVRVGTGGRIVVASHNYKVEVDANAGETVIYSTNACGDTVKAELKLDNSGKIVLVGDGNITLNGESKSFVTYAELNSALQTLVTALNSQLAAIAAGASAAISASGFWTTQLTIGGLTLDISGAETQTVKTGG